MEGITEGAWANTSPWSDEAVASPFSARPLSGRPRRWIESSYAPLTDVTAFSALTALGVSADTDSYPLFDPKDNSFWFVRNGTDVTRVLDGGTQPMKGWHDSSDG